MVVLSCLSELLVGRPSHDRMKYGKRNKRTSGSGTRAYVDVGGTSQFEEDRLRMLNNEA
jgi:hypothetical protein